MGPECDAPATAVVEHLFRHESGRMLAGLVRILGLHNFDLAEEIVQEALVRALETWRFGRVPQNPAAWLMLTARNGALDVVRRERSARRFAPDLSYQLDSEWTLVPTVDELLIDSEIRDDQLRMMFSCCHPRLAPEVQMALMLKILCGFGTREIARAFLAENAAIERRIARGKEAPRRATPQRRRFSGSGSRRARPRPTPSSKIFTRDLGHGGRASGWLAGLHPVASRPASVPPLSRNAHTECNRESLPPARRVCPRSSRSPSRPPCARPRRVRVRRHDHLLGAARRDGRRSAR